MIVAKLSQDDSFASPDLRLFEGRRDDRNVEIRRIGPLGEHLVDGEDGPGPNPETVRKIERKLHAAIKGSSLFGSVLSFAGLNIWVDDRTPDGVVEMQESINL